MNFLTRIAAFFVFKASQMVWTTYMIGVLIKGRIIYGKDYFKKVEHKKPKCLEGWNEGYLQLDNIRMHYVQTGRDDAPLLLMLHGYPEFWYSWRYQLRHFEKDYRCVAIDMRGYNLTDKPSNVSDYQLPILANDVKQVIEKLGHKKAFLKGHDWGAAVAWRTAQMFPDHIEKLIILNTPHPNAYSSGGIEQLYQSWYIFFFQSAWIPELCLSVEDYSTFNKLLLGKRSGIRNKQNITADDMEAYKYVFSQPGALTPPINYYRSLKDRTLVKGEDRFVKYCRNGQVKLIEGASHWVMQDEPELMNKYVEEFLKEGDTSENPKIEEVASRPDSPLSKL